MNNTDFFDNISQFDNISGDADEQILQLLKLYTDILP